MCKNCQTSGLEFLVLGGGKPYTVGVSALDIKNKLNSIIAAGGKIPSPDEVVQIILSEKHKLTTNPAPEAHYLTMENSIQEIMNRLMTMASGCAPKSDPDAKAKCDCNIKPKETEDETTDRLIAEAGAEIRTFLDTLEVKYGDTIVTEALLNAIEYTDESIANDEDIDIDDIEYALHRINNIHDNVVTLTNTVDAFIKSQEPRMLTAVGISPSKIKSFEIPKEKLRKIARKEVKSIISSLRSEMIEEIRSEVKGEVKKEINRKYGSQIASKDTADSIQKTPAPTVAEQVQDKP